MGGGGIVLPDGTDLNGITAYGVYRINNALNGPAGFSYTTLFVMVGQDVVTQLMISNQTGVIAARGGITSGGGWGAWNIQLGSAQFDPDTKYDKAGGQLSGPVNINTPQTISYQACA